MNPIISVKDVTVTYRAKVYDDANPFQSEPAEPTQDYTPCLHDISFSCEPGTITLICGASGSGKSSALRLLNGLVPHFHNGILTGHVNVDGQSIPDTPLPLLGNNSATVFQNPKTQFFTGEVNSELAFRGENYGEDPHQIRQKSAAVLDRLHIEYLTRARFTQMSGGELQKVACAQALVAGTDVLLFDEPTSNLSPQAIAEFSELLKELKEQGKTIVVAEHRLYFLKDLVDQVLLLEHGLIAQRYSGQEFFAMGDDKRQQLGLRALNAVGVDTQPVNLNASAPTDNGLVLNNVNFSYGPQKVISIDRAVFPAGEVTALIGDNGVGKSTLARLISGLEKPAKGSHILLNGTPMNAKKLTKASYMVMQDVHRQLFSDSVLGEVKLGRDADISDVDAKNLLDDMDLGLYGDRHPLSLSGGQKQRLVIASALASHKQIYIFDEPTSGVDYRHLQSIATQLRTLADSGAVVIVITHDPELITYCADSVARLALVEQGGAQQCQRFALASQDTPTPTGRTAMTKQTDDKLGHVGETRKIDAAEQDNKAKYKAGHQALRRLTKPVAGVMIAGRILSALSAILAVVPYVALVHLGGLLLEAYRANVPVDADQAWFIVMILIAAFTTRLGLYMLALALTHFADNRLRAHIRSMIIDRIGRAPLSWFSATNSGRIRKAVQDDAATVHSLVAHAPVETTSAMVMPLALLVYAFIIDWRLGLVAISIFPLFGGFYAYMMRGMGEKTAEMDTRMDKISATMVEFVAGITVVKAFGRVGQAHRNYTQAAHEFSVFYNDWCQPLLRGSSLAMALIAVPVMLSINLGGGYLLVQAGYVTPVQVLSTSLIALVIPASLIVLGNSSWAQQLAGAAALRILAVTDTQQLSEPTSPTVPTSYDITFEGVSFSYGDTKAVDNVSAHLPQGTVTALIGPSGSGKSTLATLVARFSDVDEGAVKIGGVDVRDIPSDELYKIVAFVLQDPQLLRASIWDNITLGKPDATEQQVRDAAQKAYIDDFITSLPDGYNTIIGEDTNISGGQAQRIAIARSLLIDAPILLLDEATAFTDPDSEAEIQAALSRLAKGRTVVAIAHRPASIIGADKIIVMERGRIVAEGTHEELRDQHHYQLIWQRSGAQEVK